MELEIIGGRKVLAVLKGSSRMGISCPPKIITEVVKLFLKESGYLIWSRTFGRSLKKCPQ